MDRRAHYLDVALRLFATNGFHGVSVDQIVAEAGGSKATLYRYFPSKRHLFEAMIDDLASGSLPPEMGDQLEGLPLREALTELGTRIARAALDERTIVLLRLAVGEAGRFPELGQVLFDRGPAVSYDRFRRFVASRVAAGELEVEDLEIAAEQFIAGIVGHQQLRMSLGVSSPSPADIEQRVHAAVEVFLAAHAADAGRPAGSSRRARR